MASESHGVKPEKPVHVLKKPVRLQVIPFVGALLKGICDLVTLNPRDAIEDVAEMAAATGLQTRPEEKAWNLIITALLKGLTELFAEHRPFEPSATPPDMGRLEIALGKEIEAHGISIDQSFFKHPDQLPLLGIIASPLKEWLVASGASEAEARNIVRRLPSYFTYALHENWRTKPAEYSELLSVLDSPFIAAQERELAWERQRARLQRQINEPMFGETFGIVHVYIPLCASVDEDDAARKGYRRRVVVNLGEELSSWVERAEGRDAIRVIAGGPGSGKSSFARMFAAQMSAKGHKVLYVPLHRINAEKDLESAIGSFVREQDLFPINPLAPEAGADRVLLLLDGLDELAMQGKASAEAAQKFIHEVQRYVSNRNQIEVRVQVLFGGRDIVVNLSMPDLRQPRQILHLLPYYVESSEVIAHSDPQGLLREDKRNTWWKNYGLATGNDYAAMPPVLARSGLDDITAQPLLGYLVALTFVGGKLDLTKPEGIDRNTLYRNLIVSVYNRVHEGKKRLPDVQSLDVDSFTQILEEIALATWHGDGRVTTVRAIFDRCREAGLVPLFKAFEEEAERGAIRLLTAFYFRQGARRQHDGDRTFEFTHKSFREYLTARGIVRAIERMDEETTERQNRVGRGWSTRDALKHWTEIAGPTPLDNYILRFIRSEALNVGPKTAAKWQRLLSALINHALREGVPMEVVVNPRRTFAEEASWARNAEESLLSCLGACAAASGEASAIDWADQSSFAALLHRLRGVARGSRNNCAYAPHLQARSQLLQGLDFSYFELAQADMEAVDLCRANLYGARFAGANLKKAQLRGAEFSYANFSGAILAEASLSGSRITWANFDTAILEHCDLRGSLLSDCSLRGASLIGALLSGARLRQVKLDGASLDRVDLSGITFSRVTFIGAKLNLAKMNNAVLSQLDFSQASLRVAILSGADLSSAVLNRTDLRRCGLRNANLEGARFVGADLRGADLRNANLRRAVLQGANLKGANLRGADLRHVNVQAAILEGADLEGAYWPRTKRDVRTLAADDEEKTLSDWTTVPELGTEEE